MAPPPTGAGRGGGDSRRRDRSRRGGVLGGNGTFPPTPHLGDRRRDTKSLGGAVPDPGGRRGYPGRVVKAGGTSPVLSNRGIVHPAATSPRAMGVPPSLTPRSRTVARAADNRGVIQPPAPRPAATSAPSRDRRRDGQNPEAMEYEERLFHVAGVPAPVIDTPPEPRRSVPGPAIGC
ncbi:MAG: hypothetical protein ACRDTU_21305 [Micromonosporaceae bacterium]